jgi:hypothetical protein
MKFRRVCYTVLVSLFVVAALFALSEPIRSFANSCVLCDVVVSSGSIGAQAMPNKFVTHTTTACDFNASGTCSWDERMLILKYSTQLGDWVKISDSTKHVVGNCGNTVNFHTESYSVGTGLYHAELDVKDVFGNLLDSDSMDASF